MILEVSKKGSFKEEFVVDADKSISHRSVIFSLLTEGENRIRNFLEAEDTLNSLEIAKKLGAEVIKRDNEILIKAPFNIKEADDVLYCGNSGTTIRIYMGLLAGVDGFFVLTGDKYLRKRPMKRVAAPLKDIGAIIDGRENSNLAPICIRGSKLKKFYYESKIASAQVKSAMVLAALLGEGGVYIEPSLSRDHTERMLKGMGASIEVNGLEVKIEPLNDKKLAPLNIDIPNDPSSAFFFAVAAAISNSQAIIKNITLNPTRIEAYKVLEKMGAEVEYILKDNKYEPIGDIIVKGKELKGVEVKENIPWLIDELPALSIAMALADGVSIVKNAKELRVKESDRISSVVENLRRCGVEVKEFEDGYEIKGTNNIKSALIDSKGDHRIAMSFAILGIISDMKIKEAESIYTSFPNFFNLLEKIAEYRIIDEDN